MQNNSETLPNDLTLNLLQRSLTESEFLLYCFLRREAGTALFELASEKQKTSRRFHLFTAGSV